MKTGNCLNCGKEFIMRHKNHKYCCTKCKEEYSYKHMELKSFMCDNCGTYFKRKNYKRYKHVFCSNKCEKEFKYNKTHKKRKCKICNKEFECLKSSTQKFCSIKCQGKWQSTQIGKLNPRFTSELIKCDWCNKQYYEKKYKIESFKNHFCSAKCRQEWYSKYWSQTKEWKEKSQKRAVQMLEDGLMTKTNTTPQIIINNMLNKLNIKYENEKGFRYCAVDNFLCDYNLIIEVMGTYWHTDNRFYSKINYDMQVNRIKMDKIKHKNIKNDYKIEILYLWENDIYNNSILCEKLIKEYIKSHGILKNYHSFNYIIKDNKLKLSNDIIIPYMNWEIKELKNIIDIKAKEKMCKKQVDKWITYNCEYCGQTKEELITHYKKSNHHYCSKECSSKARNSKVKTKCNNCGKEIEVMRSKFNKNKRFFCNQTCQHEYQKEVGFKKDNRDIL